MKIYEIIFALWKLAEYVIKQKFVEANERFFGRWYIYPSEYLTFEDWIERVRGVKICETKYNEFYAIKTNDGWKITNNTKR